VKNARKSSPILSSQDFEASLVKVSDVFDCLPVEIFRQHSLNHLDLLEFKSFNYALFYTLLNTLLTLLAEFLRKGGLRIDRVGKCHIKPQGGKGFLWKPTLEM